jgi:hypothetical protein
VVKALVLTEPINFRMVGNSETGALPTLQIPWKTPRNILESKQTWPVIAVDCSRLTQPLAPSERRTLA